MLVMGYVNLLGGDMPHLATAAARRKQKPQPGNFQTGVDDGGCAPLRIFAVLVGMRLGEKPRFALIPRRAAMSRHEKPRHFGRG